MPLWTRSVSHPFRRDVEVEDASFALQQLARAWLEGQRPVHEQLKQRPPACGSDGRVRLPRIGAAPRPQSDHRAADVSLRKATSPSSPRALLAQAASSRFSARACTARDDWAASVESSLVDLALDGDRSEPEPVVGLDEGMPLIIREARGGIRKGHARQGAER